MIEVKDVLDSLKAGAFSAAARLACADADQETVQRGIADVLTALRQSTRSVFVVEHDDDLAAEFSSQYVVTREGGASRVEVSK